MGRVSFCYSIEETPHNIFAGQFVSILVQEEQGADERREVAVVSTHVRDAGVLRTVGQLGIILRHRQRVDVGAEGDATGAIIFSNGRVRSRALE